MFTLETTQEQVTALQQGIAVARNALSEDVTQLTDVMEQSQQQFVAQIQMVVDRLTQHHTEFGTKLTDVNSHIVKAQVDHLLDQSQDKIDRELKNLIEKAVRQITDAVAEMRQNVMDGKSDSAYALEAIEPLIHELESVFNAVQSF